MINNFDYCNKMDINSLLDDLSENDIRSKKKLWMLLEKTMLIMKLNKI